MDGQLSLFDFACFNNAPAADSKPKAEKKVAKKTAKEVISAVKEKVSDYLQKGEKISTLAKEAFEKKYKAKYDFSEFEKKIFTAEYDQINAWKCKHYDDWDYLKPIAKEFRKILSAIIEPKKGDEAFDKLMSIFDGYYDFELSESPVPGYAVERKGFDCTTLQLKVNLSKGILICHGLKEKSHSQRCRNAYFVGNKKSGYYHHNCMDLAFMFAYLYMLMVVGKEISKSKAEETFFLQKNAKLFDFDLEDKNPFRTSGYTLFAIEGVFAPEELQKLKSFFKMDLKIVPKGYVVSKGEKEASFSRGNLDRMFKWFEPVALYHSKADKILLEKQLTRRFKEEEYMTLGYYTPSITVWYTLFLDIVEEKGGFIRESEFFKEDGHVARAFETKKNIPEKTVKAMSTSALNEYFSYVEFDEDVDIEKASEIANEFIAMKEAFFSQVDCSDNQIRFRKLGKHKALGLYYPVIKCLCVDINSPSSLVHEFGHLIDYKYDALSDKFGFYAIRKKYEEVVDRAMEKNSAWKGSSKYNRSYYLRPTEVFARSFEIYMFRYMGLKNSLLSESYDSAVYPTDESYLSLVKTYFDELFETVNAVDSSTVA